ncbi:adenosylmethionine-8-amino-7-oxononanoate aminotransferase [Pedobacter lusitanus]|uniref:Adenosylmethionine-8-amino-7-oxononanoate aminotransferase n=1 Tax=Pedobacter lusitanus TaxID=1503925 RepID=A0A0D0FQ68_9SPHI|nr:adenosylmethionine--8-amino-7-oxononanoate transaminase [Pedobacter lusitanus]KIO74599.1 adenosylmethionine-8-amino-7-oxononanoate aminotransferase [Pedobacter lusitanus]
MSPIAEETLSLTERDLRVIWHPYTQMLNAIIPTAIVRAEGCYLFDEDNKRYIDAISSWWVILHGHSHPYIADRVAAQIRKLDQVIFAGFTHEPAVELAEKLLSLLPQNQQKVFYTDNGSTAVEVAMKMCMQYWHNHGQSRKKVLAFHNGYHGDTFGAMSVSGRSAWTAPFDAYLFEVLYLEVPTTENIEQLKKQISACSDQLACFVYEPLVQGSAGMLMYGAAELDELMKHCRNEGVLMIQDEVFTGFGRTGKLFAANHLKEQPDVMCFSKGLTGGTMPLGVTTCSEDIYNAFLSKDKLKTLFHGHSFTANPLACTAASASIDLLLLDQTQKHIERICRKHADFARRIADHMRVKSVRQTGTILAIEWRTETGTSYFDDLRNLLYDYFLNKGILMRPLGNVIYILPPYCISDEDLDYIYAEIEGTLELY